MPRGTPNRKIEASTVEGTPEKIEYRTLFLQAIRELLPSLRMHSDEMLTKRIGKNRLEDLSLEFFCYIEVGAGKLNKNQNLALANKLLNCLVKYIQRVGTPVTLNSILNSIQLLGAAVDESFPGYAQSGLLKYTILPLQQVVA